MRDWEEIGLHCSQTESEINNIPQRCDNQATCHRAAVRGGGEKGMYLSQSMFRREKNVKKIPLFEGFG
jgi:hypothetical protein